MEIDHAVLHQHALTWRALSSPNMLKARHPHLHRGMPTGTLARSRRDGVSTSTTTRPKPLGLASMTATRCWPACRLTTTTARCRASIPTWWAATRSAAGSNRSRPTCSTIPAPAADYIWDANPPFRFAEGRRDRDSATACSSSLMGHHVALGSAPLSAPDITLIGLLPIRIPRSRPAALGIDIGARWPGDEDRRRLASLLLRLHGLRDATEPRIVAGGPGRIAWAFAHGRPLRHRALGATTRQPGAPQPRWPRAAPRPRLGGMFHRGRITFLGPEGSLPHHGWTRAHGSSLVPLGGRPAWASDHRPPGSRGNRTCIFVPVQRDPFTGGPDLQKGARGRDCPREPVGYAAMRRSSYSPRQRESSTTDILPHTLLSLKESD